MEILKKKIRKCKKGSMLDLVYLVPVLFVLVLVTFFIHKAWAEMSPELQQEDFLSDNQSKEGFQTVTTTINGLNLLIPFLLILSVIVVIILAYTIDVSPGFYIIGILIFIILIILSIMFSNIFSELSSESEFINQSATFSAPVFLMNKLPIIFAIFGLMVAIAVYAKFKIGGGGSGV